MIPKLEKTDSKLGIQVCDYLHNLGVETPRGLSMYRNDNNEVITIGNKDQKIESIEKHFSKIITTLGLNLSDDSMFETPKRVAKMFVNELFWGLDYSNFPKCTTVDNKMKYDEMVVEKNITIMSMCEHHWSSIDGYATVAYIPKNKIIGLSKLNRICEFFSRRPQIQERLTEQIFHTLEFILETDDIAVHINANHQCVRSRGVQDVNSRTVTTRLGGLFKDKNFPAARSEFMNIASRKD